MSRYLPAKVIYHSRVILGSALLSIVAVFISGEQPVAEVSLICFFMLVIQLEIFLWMAARFLNFKSMPVTKSLMKKSILKLGIFYLAILVISLLVIFVVLSGYFFIKGEPLQKPLLHFANQGFKDFLKLYAGALLFSTICYFYFQWKHALEREQRLQHEKLLFQLETLKSQVNPHFLFNSLNTLSSLVNINDGPAQQFIQKLSAIYHYILEHKETTYVDLALELDFVRDYFYLQQIRDGDKIALAIAIDDPQQYKIFPISIQLLVENALKHNLATPAKPLKISIYAANDCIVVTNNLQRKTTLVNSKKIGLNNLRERIKYCSDRQMEVIETNDEFKVIIPLLH